MKRAKLLKTSKAMKPNTSEGGEMDGHGPSVNEFRTGSLHLIMCVVRMVFDLYDT